MSEAAPQQAHYVVIASESEQSRQYENLPSNLRVGRAPGDGTDPEGDQNACYNTSRANRSFFTRSDGAACNADTEPHLRQADARMAGRHILAKFRSAQASDEFLRSEVQGNWRRHPGT